MKKRLGQLETLFFAYMQLRKMKSVRTSDVMKLLSLTQKQVTNLFRRLSRGGIVARVKPGFYLVPPRLPLGGVWSPDDILALNTIMEERDGKYQICGPNAFNRYGYDEQIPNRIYAYNNRLTGERSVGSIRLTLIKVSDERLGSVEEIKTSEGETGIYSSRARTLLDAVYDWSRFNSLPRAYEWIRRDLKKKRVSAKNLVTVTLKYGDTGTIRRMGYVLERISVDATLLRKLERALSASGSFIPLVPAKPKRGTINRRWGIVDNE